MQQDKAFGQLITRLIQKGDMTREESRDAFTRLMKNDTTPMQQGAFLAALRAKGETAQEVAGAWEAIYELDTTKVRCGTVSDADTPLMENCGTGMDAFKTFNISTAAAIVAAAAGVPMARHGSRAITSVCGTVDLAEAMGVDVECEADLVARSIAQANIGLFNGMSARIHAQALGRILSQIHFGSPLNIAASLANPARPRHAVRGVYARDVMIPVASAMRAIGYRRALVCCGEIADTGRCIDEASVCGITWCAELDEAGCIHEYALSPSALGLDAIDPADLVPAADLPTEARRFVALIRGKKNGLAGRRQAVLLNTALILKVAGKAATVAAGMERALAAMDRGDAYRTLEAWVACQNRDPKRGLERLRSLTAP
ncbi:anthranilate phosphoribosyltransferase [Desulfatitalea tepidiphila]|uniref:anthranilate phosphoribosyltransferase n=1 Tax=Desulfatitalea tepidiphila TaxID=1185843 RepID=UPI0006B3F961|nr:anthranilate phosphoribosyltransferase [Desulfatitalea tepidiphila]